MDEGFVRCPLCGFEYCHIDRYHLVCPDDLYKPVVSLSITPGGKFEEKLTKQNSFRGPSLKIYFYGECGHNWYVTFGEHKGNVFVNSTVIDPPPPQTPSYQDYIKSEAWKLLAKKKRQEAGNKCQLCNASGKLSVHHRTYENVFNESMDDLIALCGSCHAKFHDKEVG